MLIRRINAEDKDIDGKNVRLRKGSLLQDLNL